MITNPLCPHLYEIINRSLYFQEGNYLEIGAFNGAGAASVARKYPDKRIYVIDPFIEDGNTQWISGIPAYERMESVKSLYLHNTKGLDNIQHFEDTTEEVVRKLSDNEISDMNISMVLIDGDHHTRFVTIDYEFAMKAIGNKSGLIVFDDMHVSDVAEAFEEFSKKYHDRISKIDGYETSARYVEISKIY